KKPYFDILGNTRANAHWTVVFPTEHRDAKDCTCSIMLINKQIDTSNRKQVNIYLFNITAV
ncbi:hypothetical protein CPB83DRAFT_778472, partial [Crepidotus variabilis]